MQHSWLQYYPKHTPHEISLNGLTNIADAISQTCKKYARAPAVTCLDTSITFQQLEELANRFASFLQNELGLKAMDRLAIMLPNIMQFPIVFLAAQKVGLTCVNTNPLYTPREMQHQFKDSGAKAIVILDIFADKLEKIIAQTDIQHIVLTSITDQLPLIKSLVFKTVLTFKGAVPKHSLKAHHFRNALKMGSRKKHSPAHVNLDDLAVLQYTGGTTGVSKGAMLTQRNILANMAQIRAWAAGALIEGQENVLTAVPLYHILALTVNFLTFLGMGCHIFLVPKPIPIKNTARMFKKYRINVMTGVNTLFNALNHDKEFRSLAPRSIKFALAGGMALQESVSKEFQNITGIRIIEGFGLTEASPVTHCNPLVGEMPKNSCGLPLPSTVAKIVDDLGNEVAHGQEGELIVAGPQVMKGYWNKAEETEKTIKNGWLWTGDIAKRDERGFFYIVDRKKDMILVSGFNVYPNEIEEVLASHPKVLESAVVGVKNDKSGELVKAIIVKKDPSLTEEEVKEYCKENLTNYKRPRIIEFRTELPKTNVGKILRRELK